MAQLKIGVASAVIAVLDRGWGKPTQEVEANLNIFDQMSDDEQKTMLAALRPQLCGPSPS